MGMLQIVELALSEFALSSVEILFIKQSLYFFLAANMELVFMLFFILVNCKEVKINEERRNKGLV